MAGTTDPAGGKAVDAACALQGPRPRELHNFNMPARPARMGPNVSGV
jgi:hypothetical protein